MADIFLSYSSEDVTKAELLANALARHGWTVWWDRHIPPGKSFDELIEQALDSARCVIVLWSSSSVASNWVKSEATEGTRRGILIPVALEEVKFPLEFRRIETANLCGWAGEDKSPEFEGLLKAIANLINADVREPARTPSDLSTRGLSSAPHEALADASAPKHSVNVKPVLHGRMLATGAITGTIAGGILVVVWAFFSQPVPWLVVFGLPILGCAIGALTASRRHATLPRTFA
jgi:TIR domain